MKVLITGATGFLGGHLLRRLIQEGHDVSVLVRHKSRLGVSEEPNLRVFEGDIRDRSSMARAFARQDQVYHLAAWYKIGAKSPKEAYSINVEGTRNVLELAKEARVSRIVYTSTIAVFSNTRGKVADESFYYDGPMFSVYERTKWEAHYKVAVPMMNEGLPLVIVQPSIVYGPGDTSIIQETFEQYLQRKLPILPRNTSYSWAYIDDVVEGHILAMSKGRVGESYILAGPSHTLVDVFRVAEKLTGIRGPRIFMGDRVMKSLALLSKLAGYVIPLPSAYTEEALRLSAGVTMLASSEKAKRELGYQTRSLEEGLRATLSAAAQKRGIRLKEPRS